MFLLGNAGTVTQISLVSVLAIILLTTLIVFTIKYMIHIRYMEHNKAEKTIAILGYYSIASMIILFLLVAFGYNNDVVDFERSYYGLFAVIAAGVIIPFLVIFDIRQIKWIKDLTPEEQKSYGISIKDRRPLIIVVSILIIINLALFGLCIEEFVAVLQGIII